ncbi:MAG: hypothetical protein PHD00_00005 [Bacteroidales bacterium]|nr:hypothetical protein [Bacteroidales bacterium]MDD4672410.1 hypothetical protein [Bacteroidales bacterium]
MRTKNLLKLAFTMLAMIVMTGAMAQITYHNDDYELYDANKTAPTKVDYVTVGATMGYYADPDPVYHSDWNQTDGWGLTTGFVWNWSVPTAPGAAATVVSPVASFPANYVQITFPEAGDYIVNVAEESPAAFGGCEGSTTIMNVTAIVAPTATITSTDITTGLCGNQAAENIVVSITENIDLSLAGYAFKITELIEQIDDNGDLIGGPYTATDHYDFALDSKLQDSSTGFSGAASPYTFTGTSSALNVVGGNRTRYTYTLASTAGVTGTGIVSAISHKSDYLAGQVNGHTFGAKTSLVFVVNPQPVTGPIYHIPNNYVF